MGLYDTYFKDDDYSELNIKYFKELREEKKMVADPSGWTNTYSNIENFNAKFTKEYQIYHTDISNQLLEKKKFIIDLLSEWDSYSYSNNNITLCHSVTVGSVITMAFLISKGVKNILCETPNYFATLSQAKSMGLNIQRIPTYYDTNFQLNIDDSLLMNTSPCAIWLTQPRTALGLNQNPEHIKTLLSKLSDKDFLIIDEATEQMFPSILSSLSPQKYPQIIKIRSIFKGLGINGIRLAYISHHDSFREEMADEMEIFLGALDIYSLNHAVELAKDISKFKVLLSVANEQVIKLREKAEKSLMGSNCELTKIENGYIGAAIIKFESNDSTNNRKKLIEYCTKEKMPVILGASMGFPIHNNMEFIRLNYFSRDYNIINGLKILSNFRS
jgi:histidinol-phosphate/aromatic aminotransferase/cobyric acid decarboxylase-like protein